MMIVLRPGEDGYLESIPEWPGPPVPRPIVVTKRRWWVLMIVRSLG
jgi:hypothetical protein